MERFRAEGHLRAAKDAALKKGKEAQERESDEVVLEAAYQKALETETDRIKMDEFRDLYGDETVEKHKRQVKDLEEDFRKQDEKEHAPEEARRFGKILEAILIEQIELNEWLGSGVNTQQTTEYDDYLNGIDFISEFKKEGMQNFLGFAIDATHGVLVIRKKFAKIQRGLDQGILGEVQYFRSSDGAIQGRQRMIPKIVLALDKRHVVEIARLWVSGKQKELNEHPLKHIFIQEVFAQLEAQLAYVHETIRRGTKGLDRTQDVLSSQIAFLEQSLPKSKRSFVSRYEDDGLDMIHEACKVMLYDRGSSIQVKSRQEKVDIARYQQELEITRKRREAREQDSSFIRKLEKAARNGDEQARKKLYEINEENRRRNAKQNRAA